MSGKKVLVVDDDADIRDLVGIKLESAGYLVTSAHDGISGLESASTGEFDAVVLDVMMPGMSGIDVLRAMRNAEITTPVLLLTARTQERDIEVGFAVGADDYVAKPFSPRELLVRVNALIARN
ncbi:response regulator transcription factor [Pseudarthrobacter sp. J1738]|uniref:response regulator transcription factor n=1 Tax=unclassified Pseudarthrobacter TaxID=2647000 RepID=UPI003D2E7E76